MGLSDGKRSAGPLERLLGGSARLSPLRPSDPFYVAIAAVERVVRIRGSSSALLHECLALRASEAAGTCAMKAQHNDGIRNQAGNNDDAGDPQHKRQ